MLEEVANDELDDLLEDVTTATPKKEDVATDELDDLFVDVKTASPKKEDRSLEKNASGTSLETSSCVPRAHPMQMSRPQWCTIVLLMWRLTWAVPLVALYRTM